MNVQPGASFEAVAKFPTGLVGELGVRILDNQGATTVARVTAGIVEYPAGSGIYAITLTAPATGGQYTLAWDDGSDHWAVEGLNVGAGGATIGSGTLYVTVDEMKEILRIQGGQTYADLAIQIAVQSATDLINAYKKTRYYPTSETRVFTPQSRLDGSLYISDLVTVTEVTVDTAGDLSYDETWEEGIDFVLDPPNAALDGQPSREIVLLPGARRCFPTTPHSVKVQGTFGWASTPSLVQQAAVFLANRFLTRTRSAPLAILVATANEAVATARVGRVDPDVALVLDNLPGSGAVAGSIKLG